MMKSYKSESVRAYRCWDFWLAVRGVSLVAFLVALIAGSVLFYVIKKDFRPDMLVFIVAVLFFACPALIIISTCFDYYYEAKCEHIEANKDISFYLANQGVTRSDIPAIVAELEGLRE
jgi:hypothetical protein